MAPARSHRAGHSIVAGALVAMSIVAVAIVAWKRHARLAPTDIRSLAVLPFSNSAHAGEHVTDGLTELLTDDLAALPDLRVMARGSVFRYKGSSISPAGAGEALHVDAVVTGDVRGGSDRYVVRVELIDVRDGAQVWARSYESGPAELPFVRGRMSADLSRLLRAAAPAAPQKDSSRPEANEEYLLGLRDWNRRSTGSGRSKEALQESVKHFQRAIDLDPKFAAAYSGLANTYGVMIAYDDLPSGEGTMLVLAAARKALVLDPNNAEAYTSIATSSFNNLWDFGEGERHYRRSIALNPNFATAHQWYAQALQTLGRFDEARREIKIAYSLDPLSSPITNDVCWNFYFERRYGEAIEFFRGVEARDPGRAPLPCASAAYVALGQFDALLELRKTRGAGPTPALDAYRREGVPGVLNARLKRLLASPNRDDNGIVIAVTYAALGDADQAFAWLEKAYQRRDSETPAFHLQPAFDPIRNDPRFADLARRIGLPQSALEATRALAARVPWPGIGNR